MIAEIGHYALVLALALALIQGTAPIMGARRRDAVLMGLAETTALAQFAFVATAFAALTAAYVVSDFSVANVFENSHSAMPLIYKFTSVWGNHEGSMLLWVLILSLFGALVAVFGANLPATLRANALAVQSWIAAAFYLFILATSNPFARLAPAPFEGRDLNPVLQDIGLAIHPPLLYLGYVGFSISFSFAIAALIEGKIDAAWARWVRPWTLAAWCFLTVGIAMGSYWAYYELGWGGWWFWDPVENASFMPWLVGTALLHSAVVMEKRNALKLWTILLSILAFSLSLLGTFLVRSGVLTSVHSCATVFTGTLYPLALEALTGAKISVGAPYFNLTFAPLFLPLLVAVPFGPLMAWKRGDLLGAGQRLFGALALAILAVAASFALAGAKSVLAPFVIGLAFFVMAGAVSELAERTQLFRLPVASALARARGLPRSAWGTALAHFGLGVSLLGIVCETQWGAERIASVKPGQTLELRGYELRFDGLEQRQGPNYRELAGRFTVRRDGETIAVMEPAKRSFPARQNATTEAALMTRGFSQLYLSLGDAADDGAINVRLYHKPLVLLIWLGAVVMALGGALSLSDRRLRVGAPKPARMKRALQPAE